jgi:tetratricopeptide (TPR) repeat protein
MLSGRRMYEGDTLKLLRQAQNRSFVPPELIMPELPRSLQDTLQRMLAFIPADRFTDCGEVLSALEGCQADFSYRSQERQLSRLVCDLFADDKSLEEAKLAELLQKDDSGLPNPYVRPDTTAASIATGRAPVPESSTALAWLRRRRYGWRPWLAAGLAALLLTAAGLALWRHRPVPRADQPKTAEEAFQARRYAEPAPHQTATARSGEDGTHDQDLWARQAQTLMDTDPERARQLWHQVLLSAPDSAEAYFNLGLLHIRSGEYEPAIAAFEKVLQLQPQMADALFNLGFAFAKSGQYDQAIARYTQAVDLNPPYRDEILYNLATVHEIQGDWRKALQNLEMAIELNPDNDRAREYLGQIQRKYRQSP